MILLQLFLEFFKIGAFTFGGGYAMLPLVYDMALENNWATSAELIDFIAVSESTPGPFAVNIATYVGMRMGGFVGAACATLGVVMPSFIVILIIAKFFEKFGDNKIVKGAMSGLKPAVIGLISSAIVSIGKTVFFSGGFALSQILSLAFLSSLIIFAIGMYLTFKKKVHPILLIVVSAALGIAFGYLRALI